MEWLLLAAFCMIWAAVLLPPPGRRVSARTSVEEFERDMDVLAETEGNTHGRWIVTPRKGVAFLGTRNRARVRARERRRRVLVFFLESIAMTFLIGLAPPLRLMWASSAVLAALLLVYVSALVWMKAGSGAPDRSDMVPTARVRPVRGATPTTAPRYVADGGGTARRTINGLDVFDDQDTVHVVVRPARHALSAARA